MRVNGPDLLVGGLTLLTVVFALVLSADYLYADDVVDEINITVPVSCSLSGTGMATHNANVANGTYQANIGTTTLHAFCNDSEGFAIYAAGYTGNDIGMTNSNKLVGVSTNTTIVTGLATSTPNPDVSNWAMKLTTSANATYPIAIDSDTEGTFSNYHTVPNEYVKVAHRDSATDIGASATGVELTTTYAAYISKTQPADTYSGQVIYTLIHPSSGQEPFSCKPNESTITTIACMQDISSTNKASILSSMTAGQQYTLVDKRDKKEYSVAKLDDGNIWMTQNLDHDIVATQNFYTYANTDIGHGSTPDTTATWTAPTATYATDSTTWSDSATAPESYDPGDLCWDNLYGAKIYKASLPGGTTACTAANMNYHIGNYYNWTAAVAMSNSSSYTVDDSDVDQSICPAGWMLPKSGSNTSSGSFAYLVNQAGLIDQSGGLNDSSAQVPIHFSPYYFVYGGLWSGYSRNVYVFGAYWSSVAYDNDEAYGLEFTEVDYSLSSTSQNLGRDVGYYVRCVAR